MRHIQYTTTGTIRVFTLLVLVKDLSVSAAEACPPKCDLALSTHAQLDGEHASIRLVQLVCTRATQLLSLHLLQESVP